MNIFLVEDERWALAELVELFKAYEPRHRVYSYDNGDDALEAAVRIRPELVVTDITMPGISGLELVERLAELDSTIRAVILSVHDQFSYAQQGLKLGVIDYLLKPVKKEALYDTIDHAIERIQSDMKLRSAKNKWLLSQMLLHSEPVDSPLFDEIYEQPYFIVLAMAEQGLAHMPSAAEEGFREFVNHAAGGSYMVELDAQRKILLLPFNDQGQIKRYENDLHEWFLEAKQDGPIHVGWDLKQAKASLHAVYRGLDERVETNRRFAQSTWIGRNEAVSEVNLSDLWDDIRVLEAFIKKGQMTKIKETVATVVAKIANKRVARHQLMIFLNDMAYSLRYKLQQGAVDWRQTDSEVQGNFEGVATYEELGRHLEHFALSICAQTVSSDTLPKELIPVLLKWIHQNYHQNIFLQQFASEHHVSLGYLSRLFKTQTGQSFSEYLASYRMEKAKEFLAGGIERIQDVCQMVGYEDVKYFSHLFKRIVGITPTEYQKKLQAQ
ncbi:response regulator transcription factor [Paenibacillus woosongensis]|uniref:Response regulator n=1 Tax=Paenibacillus woosongensis TaxID=307580 RepID=A0A7X2Z098_9BACL|nr:response regulator [Paenibacillus woosongensis]MUG45257.1 response regulator [Paenibacillus woosongensis]